MTMEELLPLLNSGGIVVLLLFAIKLGINGQVVSRSMVREIVRQTLEELEREQSFRHPEIES